MRKYRNIKANLQPKRILKYSEEYIEYRKKRGGNSVKVEHCDADIDGFDDSIVRGWRSPAAGKTQTCTEIPPAAGPGNLEFLLPPASGPVNLEIAIETASIGPSLLNADVVKPVVGPTQLSAEETAASDLIVAVNHNINSSAKIDVYREDAENGTLVENGDLGTTRGRVISFSADGRIVLVSAWRDNSATVYEWDGTKWVQRGSTITVSSDAATLENASISPDGNTIAYTDYRYENRTGRVFVATWDSSSADYVQKAIIAGEWEEQILGYTASEPMFIGNAGERIAWYNQGDDENGDTIAQFLIYDWNGTGYELKTATEGDISFIPPNASNRTTGFHMSQDMQTAAIIYGETVYVLDWSAESQKWVVRHGKGWSNEVKEYASVAMSDDGNTLFIGSSVFWNTGGAFWIVEWSGTDWVLKKEFNASELFAPDTVYWFGFSSDCTANGNAVIVCGVQANCPAIIIRKTTSGSYQVAHEIEATPNVQFGVQCSIAGSPEPIVGASTPTQGPSNLNLNIVKPAAGPTNLLGEPIPEYGPSNLNASVIPLDSVYSFYLVANGDLSGVEATPFARIPTSTASNGTAVKYEWTQGLSLNGGVTYDGWKRTTGPNTTPGFNYNDFIYFDSFHGFQYWSGISLVKFNKSSFLPIPTGSSVYPFGDTLKYLWKDVSLTP